jgi:hypothetical protein
MPTFHIYNVSPTPEAFAGTAARVAPLKKHGQVEMMLCTQAEPTRADIPPGGSPWHEYTTYLPTWQKFFPHPRMTPFLDMDHVQKNRALLLACLPIMRQHGYTAAFSHHTPFFMPEEFFATYPHLRGARCDHPRRTRKEAFAICPDQPEALQMYTDMAAQMIADIPELTWLRLVTNDAGAGLCWSEWLYPGPNGPRHCKHIPTAQRVRTLVQAVRRGLGEGRKVDIVFNGNFNEAEMQAMAADQNELFHTQQHFTRRGHPYQVETGSRIDSPVRGIFDPVAILSALQRLRDPVTQRVSLNFRFQYSRGEELPDTIDKVVHLVSAFVEKPAFGTVEKLTFLRDMCAHWVGPQKRDDLLEALIDMHDAFTMKQIAAPRFTAIYCGTTMRAINRPLVILPELLTPEEEAYFLPYVFNPDINEGRTDYLDWHGGKLVGGPVDEATVNSNPRLAAIDKFCDAMHRVAGTLASLGDSPDAQYFARMAISLKLYACVMRSINNMFAMGHLRDRNRDKLSGPPHPPRIPPKLGDWTGDPDLLLMNQTMRDELDNTADMLRLLQNGGVQQMLLAHGAYEEDSFLYGQDFLDTLKQKQAIMTRHWTDAQGYMSTPHK